MDAKQLRILQHSLGLDQYGRGTFYRNHFVTGEGSKDHADCMALVAVGFMTVRSGSALSGGDDIFHVTDSGRTAVVANSPEPPKLSPGKQRYLDWLEADCSMSFIDWLKWKSRARAAEAR
ncbi:hypothetical protein [Sinorhizobium fredii]|uniref:hypothetical protein n=1 Tax=Rhizobium fredii TaxID=380 RepID=UPI0004AD1BE7|nr:hypothetical protein [Sinorhizobium fredii]